MPVELMSARRLRSVPVFGFLIVVFSVTTTFGLGAVIVAFWLKVLQLD